MERPMREMLRQSARRVSLHMPATGGRGPFGRVDPYRLETTELPETDDLYRAKGAVAQAQALAARSAGAAFTAMLHGGSTAGVQAMLLYAAGRGETVILPRNCHLSALHLCALAGIEPVFAEASYTARGRPYTSFASYQRAMERHPKAKAVLAVRPDYYGLMGELEPLAQAAHEGGMLLLCDEAHGATLNWRRDAQSALAQGADLAVQSAHKTLPALNAGAWLHGAEGVDAARLGSLLPMVQTSSPSFVNLLSLDEARAWMDRHGEGACEGLGAALLRFYEKARPLGYDRAQEDAPPGFGYDPLRLALAGPMGGYALGEALRLAGIDVELCDGQCVVGILPLRGYEGILKKLLAALKNISRRARFSSPLTAGGAVNSGSRGEAPGGGWGVAPMPFPPSMPPLPPRILPLAEAAFAPREGVPLLQSVGRVSAAHCGLYPPGVALVTAGEAVTPELAAFLGSQDPERLFGLTPEGLLPCVAGLSSINKGV
ncbi:MAG: DegT/DnrJ/EryC1/StrS family aminotransferase [Candidatus Limiplasma sp.]|nr:DegT/DnrJ/EryC1/StrS family aminotransferase [Candidatus Limiplasma sp.]